MRGREEGGKQVGSRRTELGDGRVGEVGGMSRCLRAQVDADDAHKQGQWDALLS